MYFIYLVYGIAGWVALALFLAYWAGRTLWQQRRAGRQERRRGFSPVKTPMDNHEKQS